MVIKNGMDPLLLGTYVANCVLRSIELVWCRNCWLCSACWMTKVSLTYLSQSLGGMGAVLMALYSSPSVNKLATMGIIGETMAVSWTCS